MTKALMQERRIEKRVVYRHRLSITTKGKHFARGVVLDWSLHGLQILGEMPLDEMKLEDKVRFHVEKHTGIQRTSVLSRDGQLKRFKSCKDGTHIGIHLDVPLCQVIEDIDKYITEEDSCYLCILS